MCLSRLPYLKHLGYHTQQDLKISALKFWWILCKVQMMRQVNGLIAENSQVLFSSITGMCSLSFQLSIETSAKFCHWLPCLMAVHNHFPLHETIFSQSFHISFLICWVGKFYPVSTLPQTSTFSCSKTHNKLNPRAMLYYWSTKGRVDKERKDKLSILYLFPVLVLNPVWLEYLVPSLLPVTPPVNVKEQT